MSQDDVVKILAKTKRPMSVKELSLSLPTGNSTIWSNLKKLTKRKEVHFKLKKVPVYINRPTADKDLREVKFYYLPKKRRTKRNGKQRT